MFKSVKNLVVSAFVAVAGLFFTASVALAQSTNPLITAATTETGKTKDDLIAMGGLLFIVTLAVWGIYRLIGMFGRK